MLLYAVPAPPETGLVTRIGGRPLLPRDWPWPVCAQCDAPMQFLAQTPRHSRGLPGLLLIFMCDNGGDCETWDLASGANLALWVPATGLCPRDPPGGVGLLLESCGVQDRPAVGYPPWTLGNTDQPEWVQEEYIPDCDCGAGPMDFVIQLEESIGANFGDTGAGYGFHCDACGAARFLWQCC